jgi:hypothetical protein
MARKLNDKQALRKYTLEQIQRYRSTFGTDDGKWVLEDLRNEFAERTSFDPTNQYATAFWEGQRHVLLAIQARLKFETKPLIEAILKDEGDE